MLHCIKCNEMTSCGHGSMPNALCNTELQCYMATCTHKCKFVHIRVKHMHILCRGTRFIYLACCYIRKVENCEKWLPLIQTHNTCQSWTNSAKVDIHCPICTQCCQWVVFSDFSACGFVFVGCRKQSSSSVSLYVSSCFCATFQNRERHSIVYLPLATDLRRATHNNHCLKINGDKKWHFNWNHTAPASDPLDCAFM